MNILKTFFALIVTVLLGGCAVTSGANIRLNAAYEPIPDVTENFRHRAGVLSGFEVRARGMSPTQAKLIRDRVEELKKQCVRGVERDDSTTDHRPNPAIHQNSRQLIAIGMGLREIPVLFDAYYRVECSTGQKR